MSGLEQHLGTFDQDVYNDELVRKLISEEKESRQALLHATKDEFEAYFERMDNAGDMIYHRETNNTSVRHSIVSKHRFFDRPTFYKIWTEDIRVEIDPNTDRSVLFVQENALAVSLHGLAFRVMKKDKRTHPSGLSVETYAQTPSRAPINLRRHKPTDEDFLREFAGAPAYIGGQTTLPELLEVRKKLYYPLGIIMSLGAETQVEYLPLKLDERVASL